jgi:hypothetical protein
MLHTPIYDVRTPPYCGPTAIAAVTGEPVSIIRDIIRSQVGTKKNGDAMPIIGVSRQVLLKTMHMLGWNVIKAGGNVSQVRQRIIRLRDEDDDVITPTTRDIIRFGDFLDFMQMHEHDGPYIVNVTKHYYAVDHDEICDTHTRIPLEIHRFKRGRRRWVQCWWQFKKLEE